MRKFKFIQFSSGILSLLVSIMAVLSVASIMDMPLLHALHHCEHEYHISPEHADRNKMLAPDEASRHPVIKHECPICSSGGHFDQHIQIINKLQLYFVHIVTVFFENYAFQSTKTVSSRQRAPPIA